MGWEGNSNESTELIEIRNQLKIYYKCTNFYEEEITSLWNKWHSGKDDPQVYKHESKHTHKQLLEAVDRYNHLIKEGIQYVSEFEFKYPDIFHENVTEFTIRDGWYDPYMKGGQDD